MNEFFATVYETWFHIYNQNYSLIFDYLYDLGYYSLIGGIFLLVGILFSCYFYLLDKNPYKSKLRYWVLYKAVPTFLVFLITWVIIVFLITHTSNTELLNAINDPKAGYDSFYIFMLGLRFAIANSILHIFSFIFLDILLLKQFSKHAPHIPF